MSATTWPPATVHDGSVVQVWKVPPTATSRCALCAVWARRSSATSLGSASRRRVRVECFDFGELSSTSRRTTPRVHRMAIDGSGPSRVTSSHRRPRTSPGRMARAVSGSRPRAGRPRCSRGRDRQDARRTPSREHDGAAGAAGSGVRLTAAPNRRPLVSRPPKSDAQPPQPHGARLTGDPGHRERLPPLGLSEMGWPPPLTAERPSHEPGG